MAGPTIPVFLAHHEQSETIQSDAGWINVYGRRTPRAGEPLPIKHPFEQAAYSDLTDALLAAGTRSLLEGLAQQFIGGNLPGRRRATPPSWQSDESR